MAASRAAMVQLNVQQVCFAHSSDQRRIIRLLCVLAQLDLGASSVQCTGWLSSPFLLIIFTSTLRLAVLNSLIVSHD